MWRLAGLDPLYPGNVGDTESPMTTSEFAISSGHWDLIQNVPPARNRHRYGCSCAPGRRNRDRVKTAGLGAFEKFEGGMVGKVTVCRRPKKPTAEECCLCSDLSFPAVFTYFRPLSFCSLYFYLSVLRWRCERRPEGSRVGAAGFGCGPERFPLFGILQICANQG